MYFGAAKIKEITGNIAMLESGDLLELTDKNKELITESPLTGSALQEAMAMQVAKQIIDVLHANNVRLVDIQLINNFVNDIVMHRNEERMAELMGKQKLDTLATAFGATENAPGNSVRNIRFQDVFNA